MLNWAKIRFPLLAGVFYLFFAVGLLYPVSLHPLTLLPGFATDTYQHLWISWWYRYALLNLHINPNNLVTLFAPDGMLNPMVWASPLPHLLSIPFQYLLGTIGTYNLFLLISFPLSGLAMYALAYDLTHSHLGGFVAGFVFAFFPAKTMHIAGHYLQFHIYWLPLYILFLLRFINKPSIKNAALTGVFLGLSVLTHFVHAAQFVFPITLIVLVFAIFRRKLATVSSLGHLLIMGVVALAIILPFYGPYLLGSAQQELEMITGGVSAFCADLMNFIVPHIWHPLSRLLPSLHAYNIKLVPAGGNYVESTAYIGIFVLAAALIGSIKHRKDTIMWAVVALVGAIFSLGPLLHINGELISVRVDDKMTFLPLPYLFFSKLPFLDAGRTPGRSGTLTMFGIALLAAYGVIWLNARVHKLRIPLLLLFIAFISLDYMISPIPYFQSPTPAFFSQIRASLGGAVLNFPSFLTYDYKLTEAPNYGLIDQMSHLRSVNAGYLYRWDPRLRNQTLALDELILPQRDIDIIDYADDNDFVALLYQIGYEYVVIRKPYTDTMPAEIKSQYLAYEWKGFTVWPEQINGNERLSKACGDPIYEDPSLWVYQIVDRESTNPGSAWLYLGKGWKWVSLLGGTPTRQLDGVGEIVIEPLRAGPGHLEFDITADQEASVTLSQGGQVIDTISLQTNKQITQASSPIILQRGSNSLWLGLAPGSPIATITVSHLQYVADSD